jgi:trehalose 6-phosphate phosphatase
MRHLFDEAGQAALQALMRGRPLLAFDFDGTLAPIVANPDEAKLRPRTKELLVRLCRLYPAVIISGRAAADVRERVKSVGFLEVIGNHGLEPWRRSDDFAKKVRTWLPLLYKRLAAHKGIVIEDKGFSIAVHYRKSREKRLAKDAIYAAAGALMPLRVVGGHQVVNLLPDGAPHKGIALGAVRDRLGCDTSLYVGDDETDEDVFARDEPGRLLTVRVGQKSGTRAAFFIENQAEIDDLLWQLLLLRSKPIHARAGGTR